MKFKNRQHQPLVIQVTTVVAYWGYWLQRGMWDLSGSCNYPDLGGGYRGIDVCKKQQAVNLVHFTHALLYVCYISIKMRKNDYILLPDSTVCVEATKEGIQYCLGKSTLILHFFVCANSLNFKQVCIWNTLQFLQPALTLLHCLTNRSLKKCSNGLAHSGLLGGPIMYTATGWMKTIRIPNAQPGEAVGSGQVPT